MKKRILIGAAVISAVAMSCNDFITDAGVSDGQNKGYFISMEGVNGKKDKDFLSRNYWEETEDKLLVFRWENSDDEMKTFVFDDGSALDFVDERKFSEVKVTALTEELNVCNMSLLNGLGTEFKDGFVMWAVSPVSAGNILSDGEVYFTMPEYFNFDPEQESATEHLRDFLLMSGTGVVSDNKCILNFNVMPAILRFKITNIDTEILNIGSVALSGPFNNKVTLRYGLSSGVSEIVANYSASSSSHSVEVRSDGGVKILPGEYALLYSLVFPTELSDDGVTMRIESNYGNMEGTVAYNTIFKNTGFESNTYYTLNIPVSRRGITLDGVGVEDFINGDTCTVNIDRILTGLSIDENIRDF